MKSSPRYTISFIKPGPFYDVGLRWVVAVDVGGGPRRIAWTRKREEAEKIVRVLVNAARSAETD